MSEHPSDNPADSAHGDAAESFLIGRCPDCDRSVLTARNLVGDELVDVCLHCDRRFERDNLEWASADRVAELGYVIDGREDDDCETHGGCRGGSCGVQQPED